MATQKSIIKVERLVKKFGDFTAVNNIDLDIKEGEIFGLLGPNGAGKTTTINVLLSLLKPTSGKVTINGLDVSKHPEEVKQMIGLMTQETVVEGDLTGTQNLMLFAELYHIDKVKREKAVKTALEESDLMNFANAQAGTYSGGMQRRLGLVKAMLHEPKILILDEPTTGLDVQNRVTMWKRIKELNANGTTILMTTQYLEEADELCSRIAIIDHGKIAAQGTPSELKKLASDGDILEVVTKMDEIPKLLNLLKTKFHIIGTSTGENVTAPLGKDARKQFVRISEAIEKEDITIFSIGMHLPTIDDVFIKLTGSTMRDTLGEKTTGRMPMMGRR
ncbi:MAG: ATP-binding cassette domain-containing protein [Candidatus Marsarchaeota archaeon]|nr:ATP-binding cassette domain-containing protein [Candidatus Marsarchaeota archaeon]